MGPLPSQSQLGLPDSGLRRNRSFNTLKREFNLWDAADFIKSGVEVRFFTFFKICFLCISDYHEILMVMCISYGDVMLNNTIYAIFY